jgi:RNA polymerase sigma-70 factor, ECF subfamily
VLPAFRELYEQYFAFTWRSLRYLGVPEAQLEDAVQELWVVVHRRQADFQGRSQLRTWLFGIAINLARNLRRMAARRAEFVPLPPELSSQQGHPELEREAREAWVVVSRFVETLDDTRRAVFVASLLEGLSAAETAELTGLDLATVYNRIRALRRAFQTWVEREENAP